LTSKIATAFWYWVTLGVSATITNKTLRGNWDTRLSPLMRSLSSRWETIFIRTALQAQQTIIGYLLLKLFIQIPACTWIGTSHWATMTIEEMTRHRSIITISVDDAICLPGTIAKHSK